LYEIIVIVIFFITNLSISQMLHGYRSDLILNCLVYSKKDRNLYLLFSNY